MEGVIDQASKEELEEAMSEAMNEKRRDSDLYNQRTMRISLYGLMLTVACMLCSGSWLISEINSATNENKVDIVGIVEAVKTTNNKLDDVVKGLSNIEGRLNPIVEANNKQAEFAGFMNLFMAAIDKKAHPSQSTIVNGMPR